MRPSSYINCEGSMACDVGLSCNHASCMPPPDTQENPELIWNDEAREKVAQEVSRMTEE